jgi:hypothetical protein
MATANRFSDSVRLVCEALKGARFPPVAEDGVIGVLLRAASYATDARQRPPSSGAP